MVSRLEIIQMREKAGFTTPIQPLEPGETMLIFDTRGVKEWLVHPEDVEACRTSHPELEVLDVWPMMNAVQIRVTDSSVNTRWIGPDAA